MIKVGEIYSESSHYRVEHIDSFGVLMRHLESKDSVSLSTSYVNNYLQSADNWNTVVKVTKEDKRDGTLGIRSIFEGIHDSTVFTVCFKKQDTAKSTSKLSKEISKVAEDLIAKIDEAKNNKKGVADVAKKVICDLVHNPILPYELGEDRILRGYKVQFESRDGRYNCIDVDIEDDLKIRPVNITTIKWLIYKGTKYIVE